MGIDLYLLPVNAEAYDVGMCYAHSLLDVPRNYELFDAIRALQSFPLRSQGISCFMARVRDGTDKGERCYGDVTSDSYGEPLRYVLAIQLWAPLIERYRTAPFAGFIRAMKPEIPVVLFWC